MDKDNQIKEMAKVICENTAIYCYETAVEIAEALYNADYRKVSEVARNIFVNLRILGHIDFEGNLCIRKDSFEELESEDTEDGV